MAAGTRTRASIWWEAARPRTLSASIAPVLAGTAAATTFIWWRGLVALVVAIGLQVGVNYANDLFDAQRGVDTASRIGPRRFTASGIVSPGAMRTAMLISFGISAAAGLALAAVVGAELLLVGAACLAAAIGYSGGPRPYGAAGMGEVSVFLFFGVVATVGSAYVQSEEITALAYLTAIPIGLLATALLVVNNLRDIETDEAARKITLAVHFGPEKTLTFYQWLLGLAFVCTLGVAARAGSLPPLLALLAAPLATRAVRTLKKEFQRGMYFRSLGATARVQLAYGALLALGLWLG